MQNFILLVWACYNVSVISWVRGHSLGLRSDSKCNRRAYLTRSQPLMRRWSLRWMMWSLSPLSIDVNEKFLPNLTHSLVKELVKLHVKYFSLFSPFHFLIFFLLSLFTLLQTFYNPPFLISWVVAPYILVCILSHGVISNKHRACATYHRFYFFVLLFLCCMMSRVGNCTFLQCVIGPILFVTLCHDILIFRIILSPL
jgi:hypothetical protein